MATIDNSTLVERASEAYCTARSGPGARAWRAIYDMGVSDALAGNFAHPQIDFQDIREGDLLVCRRANVTRSGRATRPEWGSWYGEGEVFLAGEYDTIYLLDRAPDPRAVALAEAGYIPEDVEDIIRVIDASKAGGTEWRVPLPGRFEIEEAS